MLEVTVVEHFELDRARLWDALSDLEAHREWMTDVRTLRFLTEQRSGVGTRYVIEIGQLRVRDHIEVITWAAPSELAINPGLAAVGSVLRPTRNRPFAGCVRGGAR